MSTEHHDNRGGRWIWSRLSNRLLTEEEWERERLEFSKQNRSKLSAPSVISDTMDTLVNHADCKHYDSKSKFRKATKAAGCEEIGNEAPPVPKPYEPNRKEIQQDIKDAYDRHS